MENNENVEVDKDDEDKEHKGLSQDGLRDNPRGQRKRAKEVRMSKEREHQKKEEEEYEDWLFSEENCRIDEEKAEQNEEKGVDEHAH